MSKDIYRAIGLMSGTSVDGSIDCALIEGDGDSDIQILAHESYVYETGSARPFQRLVKGAELAFRKSKGNPKQAEAYFQQSAIDEICRNKGLSQSEASRLYALFSSELFQHEAARLSDLITLSARHHADAVRFALNKWDVQQDEVDLIGYHGQTVYHAPKIGVTVQLADPKLMLAQFGIPVVFDFRSRDVELGGQGAPLAPVYHRALARRDGLKKLCVVNIGGCANITFIDEENLLAFDCGPGNALIDSFTQQRTGLAMDRDGVIAASGQVNQNALEALQSKSLLNDCGENFLKLNPPKSLDVRDFKLIPEVEALATEDGLATLSAFTARCIAESIDFLANFRMTAPNLWILAGGGAENPVLREMLKLDLHSQVKNLVLKTADELNWSQKYLEAELFAYLAIRVKRGLPYTFPQVTGVKSTCAAGKILTS